MKTTLILACAGIGERSGLDKSKLLYKIDGKTVIERTFNAFFSTGLIDQYILAINPNDEKEIRSIKCISKNATLVYGGKTRTDSVKNALEKAEGEIVLIHDGARPFVSKKMIDDCIALTEKCGCAIPVINCRDTLVSISTKKIKNYIGKQGLAQVQTPQGFKTEYIKTAYEVAGKKVFNDDGEVYKEALGNLCYYEGDPENFKLTYEDDFKKADKSAVRFGTGFDCHKLTAKRKLVLGGVHVPHDKGLLGHSDADVVLHAIMDAILSSLGLKDIGHYFPDTDKQYKNADSTLLLLEVLKIISKKGYKVSNVTACIMAEKPKLAPYIDEITKNIASLLKIKEYDVGITATTLEGLGFVGKEQGICVHATAVCIKK